MSLITTENLNAFLRGDIRAFEKIFVAYVRKLRTFILRIVNSEEDAEEITHDIFLKIWENREQIAAGGFLESPRRFDAYLLTAAKNQALNFLRNKKTYLDYLRDSQYLNQGHVHIDDVLSEEYAQLLIDMSAKLLTKRQKEIFFLSNEGLSNEEVAEKLKISRRTVDNSLSRIYIILRKAFFVFSLFLSFWCLISRYFFLPVIA